MNKAKRCYSLAGVLFLMFALLTVAVLTLDVQPIGPEGSRVGLATLNARMLELLGVNLIWYHITDWLGVAAILVAMGFAGLGLMQLIRRRRISRVDRDLLALGGFYAAIVGIYLFFEVAIVNYRPIILGAGLEASFPSSHTMIVVCIMLTAMLQFRKRIKGRTVRRVINAAAIGIMLITVFGRTVSGVHWFTDILAGLMLALSLTMLYSGVNAQIVIQ